MNSTIGKGLVFIVLLILALFLIPQILFSNTGGVSALMKFLGIGLGIFSLIKPQSAPWTLTVLFFTQDYLKKVAVYYGVASPHVLYEVMGVGYGTMLAAAVGSIGTMLMNGRFPWLPLVVYTVGALISGLVFIVALETESFVAAGYTGAAVGLPAVMAALILLYFSDNYRKLSSLINFQFAFATVWAVIALKQVYFGFSEIEWFYANTGLSKVASSHMLLAELAGRDPRPFGLGSGVASFNAIACYALYGLWKGLSAFRDGDVKNRLPIRILFLIGGSIITLAVFESRMKSSIVTLVVSLIVYFVYKNNKLTLLAYTSAIASFVFVVIKSQWLLANLWKANQFVVGHFGDEYSILTFSGRLISLETLKNPQYYTTFGYGEYVHTHDFLSMVLIKSGVIGLSVVVLGAIFTLFLLHRNTSRIDSTLKPLYVVILTMLIPFSALLALGGSGGFHVTPNNFRAWTLIGCSIFLATRFASRKSAVAKPPILQVQSPSKTSPTHSDRPIQSF